MLLVMAANLLLPLQDALSKQLVVALPVWELLLARSITVVALTLALGRGALLSRARRTRLKGLMVLRSMVILLAWIAFSIALRDLPLAQVTTIYFASPILVTLAAGPLLGERVSPRGWAAVALGFMGVCLASGLTDFVVSGSVLLALLSTACWAAALLMLRAMAQTEGPLVQVLFANGVFVLALAPLVIVQGFQASAAQLAFAAGIGLVGGGGQLALYAAARRLPASLLATLEYSAILVSFALGYAMFGETPSIAVSLGAALVLLSGLVAVSGGKARLPREPLLRLRFPRRPSISPRAKDVPAMIDPTHDLVVQTIARTRFPFPGQPHWPKDYVTLTSLSTARRAIIVEGAEHFPDIVILDGTGRIREIGEIEMAVNAASLPYLRAGSLTADDDTAAKVRHFFLYVPAGKEREAQRLLDENGVSYAGVRGFTVSAEGRVGIVPFVTPGDAYDHQTTAPQAA